MSNTITINGKVYQGKNIRVSNDVVYIDGVRQDSANPESKTLEINVVGARIVQSDKSVIVHGDVVSVDATGSVTCDNVTGGVNAGGSVSCDNVIGNVNAGGSITCDDVDGDVKAGGSVVYNKI